VNAAWKREVTLSAPEEFTYTSVDGWTVEGWVMKPAAYEEGRSYPLLLNVHGGPHANYGWGFFDEFQVQAGAGYAVLFTNPRGSQSYGEQFAHACVRDWGGKDFQDIMNGLDYALDQYPFIDRERTGVLGGSYGGFMTSWTVGHTDRFKAAISERAVNALYSMYGSSDIGFHFNFFEVGGSPQESLDFYIERSPVTYAPKMRTPLLIMHSENDLRCPIEQGEQLYVTLKVLRQTDVVFVRFPEESHELSRSGKPSRRVERFQIILDWFDRYLRPGASEPRVEKLAVAAGAL
jgi:dipeptidyl aminopeptidase/acylaminoacyl peptidase